MSKINLVQSLLLSGHGGNQGRSRKRYGERGAAGVGRPEANGKWWTEEWASEGRADEGSLRERR